MWLGRQFTPGPWAHSLPDAGGRISEGLSIRIFASVGGVLAAEHYPEVAVQLA